MKLRSLAEKKFLLLLFFLILSLGINNRAQDSKEKDTVSLPSDEVFKPFEGVIGGGPKYTKKKLAEVSDQDTIRIYNSDGSLWYEFSTYENSPLYFQNNIKEDFKPYRSPQEHFSGWDLRVKAISENWYEVVVNEVTSAIKYIPISDKMTGYLSLQHFILDYGYITFDAEKNPLRETPDGKIIKIELNEGRFYPKQIKDDWVYVVNKNYIGWVRWKRDREILVGYILNARIVPQNGL
jgi:hypothetical protein